MPSIGVAANVYNESRAIHGWLENVADFFDDVVVYHTGPGGKYSDDGTIEVLEKWGVRIVYGSIDEGFGVVRSRLVTMTNTEWTMIMDADERFWSCAPILDCDDALRTTQRGAYHQGALLRNICSMPDIDAVCTARRHWFNFHWDKPTQNWYSIPDWQLRCMRNTPHITYRSEVKMHERIVDDRTGGEPRHYRSDITMGPFHDHYHCFFKPMEPEQREHDIRIYNALCDGSEVPTE